MTPRVSRSLAALVVVLALGSAACKGADGPSSTAPEEVTGVSSTPPSATPKHETRGGHAPASPSAPGGPAVPSKGCNGGAAKAALPSGVTTNVTMTVWGNERTYDLSVPAGYDPSHAYPVVFVFHGSGGTAQDVRSTFGFEGIAGNKAVFVYPNGRDHHWNLEDPADDNQDVAFFEQLIGELETSLCIDSARVFATGYSNGGYFSNQLACRRGDLLRAIASHGGGGPYDAEHAYDHEGNLQCAGRPPAAMVVHGEWDDVVELWKGESTLSHWRWANGCDASSTATAPSPCVSFDGCKSPVVWCQIPEQGHWVWSGGAKATWDFFASF